MHARTTFNQETWLSGLSYAQTRISLVFCRSFGFLVPWLSSLLADQIWQIFCVMYVEEAEPFSETNLLYSITL